MINQIIKWIVFKCIYPFWYDVCAKRRLKEKKILFVENHLDKLSHDFTLLYKELEKRGYEIHVHYLKVAGSKWGAIIRRTLHLLSDMADARCVFISESNSVFGAFSLRTETKLVQIWHACGAFKKWGFSVAQQSFGEDTKTLLRYSGHRNYSLVPVSGKAVCWAYEEAFGLQGREDIVKPLGVSRTDVFFCAEAAKQADDKRKRLKIAIANRRVILYAPTFRGEIKEASSPKQIDYKEFYDKFHTEYVLFIKQHPFVKTPVAISEEWKDSVIEITDEMTTEELLMTADICITDYSSIIFEYSLLGRPMIFFANDLADYYDERGFYYPYQEFVPGVIVTNMKELEDTLENIDSFSLEKVRKFRETYMSGCDGHATERILAEVL